MLDRLLDEYLDKFGENFPIYMTRQMTDDQLLSTIEGAIKSGKPYSPKIEEDVLY